MIKLDFWGHNPTHHSARELRAAMAEYTDPKIFVAARHTLSIIQTAKPVDNTDMFPDYHNAPELCSALISSLSAWPTTPLSQNVNGDFVRDPIRALKQADSRKGMQLVKERVYYFVPSECDWSYFD